MSGASQKVAPGRRSPDGQRLSLLLSSPFFESAGSTFSAPAPATIPEKGVSRQRSMSAEDLEGLVRILGVSGRRLVECDGEWRILPRGDRRRRALMTASAGDVERLRSKKLLVASANGYVLSTDHCVTPDDQPAAGPWIFTTARALGAKGSWRGFARLAELARHGRGPLSLRQALAGLRLIEDAEAAARDPMLTMNWDAVPADRNTRSGHNGGLPAHARRAAQRIERIRAVLGERDFTIVHAACVQRVHLKTLERRFGLKRLGARRVLPEALEKVAEVYDG